MGADNRPILRDIQCWKGHDSGLRSSLGRCAMQREGGRTDTSVDTSVGQPEGVFWEKQAGIGAFCHDKMHF